MVKGISFIVSSIEGVSIIVTNRGDIYHSNGIRGDILHSNGNRGDIYHGNGNRGDILHSNLHGICIKNPDRDTILIDQYQSIKGFEQNLNLIRKSTYSNREFKTRYQQLNKPPEWI